MYKCACYQVRKREAGLDRAENIADEAAYTSVKMGRERTEDSNGAGE